MLCRIGFVIMMLGIASADSSSLAIPFALVAIGALLILTGDSIGNKEK